MNEKEFSVKIYNPIIPLVLFLILVFSCKQNQRPNSENIWNNTTQTSLDGESINFKKPNQLKRSSRYRIKEDLLTLNKDTSKLTLLQNQLEFLEFEDAEIDVFVDTTTNFRLIIIYNTQRINFNKKDVAIIKKKLKEINKNSELINPKLSYGQVKATMNGNGKLLLAKYKYEIINSTDNSKTYSSLYFLTAKAYTLVVFEFSDKSKDIEKYLWSVKSS